MKRAMLLLMALLALAHAALAEDFSAYAVKTNGFAVFAPNPILAAAACIAICRMRSQTIRVGVPLNLCRLAANAM